MHPNKFYIYKNITNSVLDAKYELLLSIPIKTSKNSEISDTQPYQIRTVNPNLSFIQKLETSSHVCLACQFLKSELVANLYFTKKSPDSWTL